LRLIATTAEGATVVIKQGPTWTTVMIALGSALIGGIGALVGGWISGVRAARFQETSAAAVAAALRRAERQEKALVDLDSRVLVFLGVAEAFAEDPNDKDFHRAIDLAGEVVDEWRSRSERHVSDETMRTLMEQFALVLKRDSEKPRTVGEWVEGLRGIARSLQERVRELIR
jgi:hypothetical protein